MRAVRHLRSPLAAHSPVPGVLRWSLIPLGLALMALLVTGPGVPRSAEAHNAVVSTSPADGATVGVVPDRVVLTFNEPARAVGTVVRITGPNGPVQRGPAALVDDTVSQAIGAGAPAGAYRVEWRVVSSDGHPISGSSTFKARQPGTGPSTTPSPAASSATTTSAASVAGSDSGGPTWPVWVGAGAVALALAGAVVLVRRRP